MKAAGTPEKVFIEENLSPIYGSHLQVISHPEYGTALVLPAGPDSQYSPRGRGYTLETQTETKVGSYA